ncbi:MAG: hypothetical protein IJT96_12050 [Lachnospiraceae bacterium]|nr:hypothetical protein [Lachnospiraceae bacterium]
MRKQQKEQCIETLKLIGDAHKEITADFGKGKADEAIGLLEQCQQGAISVGGVIEDSVGEGTKAVQHLEEYCELAYRFHEEMSGTEAAEVNAKQHIKQMQKCLDSTINEIRNRIPTHKEVVFLPYKASMWDSLETVWRKMDKDENVTAIVIPIPYYDKDANGSLTAGHYEADLFPTDVPVMPYSEYDFEVRRPDSIYIHNPYDECNYATSVHPDFYSKVLNNYTDDLVYIPYFVLNEIDPKDREAVDDIDYLITLPGVLNADRVIVQSEDMKKIYVDVLCRHYGAELRPIWQKKIYGEGSPKIERVMSLKAEDFEIPEEWKKFIECDGRRKKVILYNTSVEAFLDKKEAMIEKIRRSLGIFYKKKDYVTLLWRPHPLMESTIASMLPGLFNEYAGIVSEYKDGNWGIFDETANVDRAIAISDAYYGDMSSLVWLYKQTGKPIMIQDVG